MKTNYEKLLWRLVYIICSLFLVFYVAIQFNNRVNNPDEFLFLTRMNNLGFWKSLTNWQYNQRPVSYFLFNLTFVLNERLATLRWSLFIANLVLFTLLLHSMKIVVARLLLYVNIHFEQRQLWSFALLIVMSYFFFCFERSEVWFWYICTIIYLLPVIFVNYGCVLLFKKGRWSYLSIVFFFLIGGTLELMIPFVGCLLLVFYLNKSISFTKLFLNGFSLLFFSFFQLLNKGIENRIQLESNVMEKFESTFSSTFMHLFDKKNVFFILLLILILTILNKYRSNLKLVDLRNLGKWMLLLLIIYALLTWFVGNLVFPGSFGVLRMWAPFSYLLMIFIFLLGIWLSLEINFSSNLIGVFASITFVGLFGVFSFKQLKMTTQYSHVYDAIIGGENVNVAEVDSGILISTGDFNLLKDHLALYDNTEIKTRSGKK